MTSDQRSLAALADAGVRRKRVYIVGYLVTFAMALALAAWIYAPLLHDTVIALPVLATLCYVPVYFAKRHFLRGVVRDVAARHQVEQNALENDLGLSEDLL